MGSKNDSTTIVLLGVKHCGKTSLGRLLARKLNIPFYDSDSEIQKLTGKTPREIYAASGSDVFMKNETDACKKICEYVNAARKYASSKFNAVISSGGGICNNQDALNLLKKGSCFVFLKVDESIAFSRIAREIKFDSNRNMTDGPAYIAKKNPHSIEEARTLFHAFYEQRTILYEELSDITIELPKDTRHNNLVKIYTELEKI